MPGGGPHDGPHARRLARGVPDAPAPSTPSALDFAALADLPGDLLRPGDAGSDEARHVAKMGMIAAPPLPFVPAEHHGSLALLSMVAWDGDPAEGRAALAPYAAVATPIAEVISEMPYPAIFEMGGPEGRMGFVARPFYLPALDDAAIDTILDFMERRTSSMAMVQLRVLGGAVSRVPNDATAYAFRDEQLAVVVIVPFMDPAEAATHAAWADGLLAALRPAATGVYSNFLDDEGPARVREAYPGLTWHRLGDVKRRYDPTNLFRSNQGIVAAD